MATNVVILMGSKSDLVQAQSVAKTLKTLEITYRMRVCSAHKATTRLLQILKEYENSPEPLIYITIAGRSNALSAVFGGMDILSSLRLPSGIASPTILEPEGAALLAAKMLALTNEPLRQRVIAYKEQMVTELIDADKEVFDL